jgi:hypothetical protein
VRILGYFSKPIEVREQKSWETLVQTIRQFPYIPIPYKPIKVHLFTVGLEILEICYTTGMYKLQIPVFVEVITLFFHDTITRNTFPTYSYNRLMIVVMN